MPSRDDFTKGKPEEKERASEPQHAEKVAEMLQSQLIHAFETAIYQGMQPMDALAIILSWMASEMVRIQADLPKQTSR